MAAATLWACDVFAIHSSETSLHCTPFSYPSTTQLPEDMNSILMRSDPSSQPHLLYSRLSPSPSKGTSPATATAAATLPSARLRTETLPRPLPRAPETCILAPEHHLAHISTDMFFPPPDFSNNSPHTTTTASMSSRKRKASEEPDNDRMSTSPTASPSMSGRPLPSSFPRSIKRTRTSNPQGRPLALPRLLETLSADEMRNLLQNVCDQHPELQRDIVTQAPRPSVQSTLAVLRKYETAFREAFPYGNRTTSDYSYNRVRSQLLELIDAVKEYTPHFLPPHETQDGQSLDYLDAVTTMIHDLPDWDTFQHQRCKNEAYDEIAKAWGLVIREAAKRAGGFHLQFGGWDQKLMEHNRRSGGKMDEAVEELKKAAFGYTQTGSSPSSGISDERASIRQQLFSGSYGQHVGVGPGGW